MNEENKAAPDSDPKFSYERKTAQALPPWQFYLRSWRQPLARWSVCASSHGHRFFPTGLLRGHRVFSQTPGARRSAAPSPCAWTTGTGPLSAGGGREVAPSERPFPPGLWLPTLWDTVHLEWEKQGCVSVPTSLSSTDSMGGWCTLNELQTGTVTCTEFQSWGEKLGPISMPPLNSVPCVYRKHWARGERKLCPGHSNE